MNTAVNTNVVHESEAQRQHARVKIPAKLRLLNGAPNAPLVRIEDLSAGGLSYIAPAQQRPAVGEVIQGRLQFLIDNLGLAMDVELQVRSLDAATGASAASSRIWKPRTLPHCAT